MTYDGEGKRTRLVQTPATGNATTIDFRYQGAAVAEETQTTSGGPTISRRFIVDDTGRAIKLSVAGDPVGANNGTYVIVWNGHGDATGLWQIKTDGTLEKANTFTYDTWGRPARTVYGAYTDLGFRYLYVGAADVQWDDAYGAGLLYMHARSYSPTLGRFLQPDPIAAEGNLYGYAGNSPITKADASGQCWQFLAGGLATSPETLGTGALVGIVLAGLCAGLVSWETVQLGSMAGRGVATWTRAHAAQPKQLVRGKEFEQNAIRQLRREWPYVAAPKYFNTKYGARLLDACAYSSYRRFLADPLHPIVCWEIKSTSGAYRRYYYSSQALKDQWLRDTYHFPIEYILP